jgi:hypothetical protein
VPRTVCVAAWPGTKIGMRSDMRTYWRRPDYWRWWWQEVVSSQTKWGLAALVAIAFGILGYLSAEGLTPTQQAASFTTEQVVTVVRKSSANASRQDAPASLQPAQTVTVFKSQPGEATIVTVRRGGRAVVIRKSGKPVEKVVTVAGAVQERVVTRPRTDTVVRTETAERLTTVTMPGDTKTVTREVTLPSLTVMQTHEATVTQEITVTDMVTVTQEVTVTKPCNDRGPNC